MSNLEIVEAIYHAVGQGDLATVLSYLDAGVTAHQAESLPYAGVYRGPAGFQQMGEAIFNTWSDFQSKPHKFVHDGDTVIVLATMTGMARRTSNQLDMPLAECWSFRDGKVIDIQPFYWDTAVTNALLNGNL